MLLLTLAVCAFFLDGVVCTENDTDIDQIVGAYTASKGQFPFMVAFFDYKVNKYICSGTLVKANKVITSCAFPNPANTAAIFNTLTLTPDADRIFSLIHSIVYHSSFNNPYGLHNLAIVTLQTPAPASVRLCSIAENVPIAPGNQAVTMGWGYSTFPATNSLQLDYITLQNIDPCKRLNSNYVYGGIVCASSPRVTACGMDKGVPLLYKSQLIGMELYSECGVGLPIAYVYIQPYLQWIKQNI